MKPDESLVPITTDPALESVLLELLASATECADPIQASESDLEALDARHHQQWAETRANYITENRQWAEHRAQSLTVSHRARCKAIEDQIARANNAKIRLMKESELARAQADYEGQLQALLQTAGTSEIVANTTLAGFLVVKFP